MSLLFLDTSSYLQFGLISKELEWIDFREIQNKKGSSILHGELHRFFEDNHIKGRDIKKIILGNGPGSYTGIRLGEGISQIFEWQGTQINSFYGFEIPCFSGIEAGSWCARAFKDEVFIYEWNDEQSRSLFLKTKDFKSYAPPQGDLYHTHGSFLDKELKSTTELLRKSPKKIFHRVLEQAKHLPPCYFRPLEKEFKICDTH